MIKRGEGTILEIDYDREVLVLEVETEEGPQVFEVPFNKISRNPETGSLHIDSNEEEFNQYKKTEVQKQ